jgi:hypothetical protein
MRLLPFVLLWRAAAAADLPASLPETGWRLAPKSAAPAAVTRERMLDALDRGVRSLAVSLDARGAMVDPFVEREFQYSTPYFAHAVGVLLKHGRARDLAPAGVRAMEHATECFAGGAAQIPDRHGEFFIPALAEALPLYEKIAPAEQWQEWRERLRTPLMQVIDGFDAHTNNWRMYAMRGEWLRVKLGLAPRDAAIAFIERSWTETQRERMTQSRWNLYLDRSSDPNSQAVEAVGRANLQGLLHAGYDGPSAAEMRRLVDRATRMALLLQDPAGQAPPNGRTDMHVWNDILYQLSFEMAAAESIQRGDRAPAGVYRRAATLAFLSAMRWQRADGAFQITKNFFPNELRIGYQPASQWTNYNGAALIHLAEAIELRQGEAEETMTPAEAGGYAFANDPQFASAFANAGGMQMMVNLRGETDPARYNVYWTPLGVARFSRPGWDSRLGPADGARDTFSGEGVSFGPTWREGNRWVRLASAPARYRGVFESELATPALTLCSVRFEPVKQGGGPVFTLRFTITPEGILVRQEAAGNAEAGLTLPLHLDDGRSRMRLRASGGVVSVTDPSSGAEQSFLFPGATIFDTDEDAVRGPGGWLKPVRAEASTVFIYPRNAGDAPAAEVRESLRVTPEGFFTSVVVVRGNLATGRNYLGGRARSLDLNRDGLPDLEFSEETGFMARHEAGRIVELETDRPVEIRMGTRTVRLGPHEPERAFFK